MPEELLQRLRDIHYPADPGWFPPAPGWWILAAIVLAAILWAASVWRRRKRLQAPYTSALGLLDTAAKQFANGELPARDYLDYSNQILKRVLIHIRHDEDAVAASGARWLTELDALHESNQFTQGPGRVLGNDRFARDLPNQSLANLHQLLHGFINKLQKRPDELPVNSARLSEQPAHD